jgi:Short C-terminal domain
MKGLTPEGQRTIEEIASRNGFSTDAASALFRAIALGNGAQAQFNHPELGGMGQWSQGGMIMIGDMFNQGLKQRVNALCDELANALHRPEMFAHDEKPSGPTSWQAQNYNISGASVSVLAQTFGHNWWPDGLGKVASLGSQNDLQYAYFPSSHRLAFNQGGRVTVYDTADHNISGVSQQQSGDQSLTFTSQYGLVRLRDLKVVSPQASPGPSPAPSASPPTQAAPGPAPAQTRPSTTAATGNHDIFTAIEKLAELRKKNILSEEEFSAKKAELLGRL